MANDEDLALGRTQTEQLQIAAAAAAADASGVYVKAPFDGVVESVTLIAASALTGANTESRTFQLFNRGQDGSGTTKVAEKAFTSGVNAAADDETAITVITAADANVVAAGDLLEAVSLHVGSTGLAGPAGTMLVTFNSHGEE